jgi:predicted transcriptional regulator of viral defense system
MSTARGISTVGRDELARVVGRGRRFVRPSDAAAMLDVDQRTAAKKLAQWAEQGWLRRARRGLYIPVPVDAENPGAWSEHPWVVAAEVWRPCYITGWTAANHWHLSEQVFRTTVVKTTARVRSSKVVVLDHEYLLRHAPESLLEWGIESEWIEETRVRVADPARTVVDILDEPRLGGGIRHCAEILTEYLANHDAGTLIDYGDRLGNRAVFKRLGYLVVASGDYDHDLVAACRSRISIGISALDPGGPDGGVRVAEWGLRVNAAISPAAAS